MSDDPVDQIIEVLTQVSSDVQDLKKLVEAGATKNTSLQKIETALTELRKDVKRADPRAVAQTTVDSAAADLRQATSALRAAIPAVRDADGRRGWIIGVGGLLVVVGLLGSFIGGVVYIRSGVALDTAFGCRYLGGQWTARQDGKGMLCWREVTFLTY